MGNSLSNVNPSISDLLAENVEHTDSSDANTLNWSDELPLAQGIKFS